MSIHDSNSDYVRLSNFLWQEKINRECEASHEWLENFYREHPEVKRSEYFKHWDDPDYWKIKPCWKSFVQSVVFYLTGGLVILFPMLWEEQHPMYIETADEDVSESGSGSSG